MSFELFIYLLIYVKAINNGGTISSSSSREREREREKEKLLPSKDHAFVCSPGKNSPEFPSECSPISPNRKKLTNKMVNQLKIQSKTSNNHQNLNFQPMNQSVYPPLHKPQTNPAKAAAQVTGHGQRYPPTPFIHHPLSLSLSTTHLKPKH